MDFNRYFTNAELEAQLREWEKSYPKLIQINEIGKSYEKRPIWLATLTNREGGSDIEKPAVWIDANIHATEIAGTTTALKIIHTLLDGYGTNEQAMRLLNECTYYIVPRANPDGAELAMAKNPKFIRSGVRAYPWPEKEEGLHAEDVDKDGRVLQMRMKDPNGDWKVSSLDPRLMDRRGPDEHGGTYYRLFTEGILEDYDGYLIKVARAHQGLDFNRNFPVGWRPDNEQQGAGPYPASEPEIQAMVDFISKHPNINAALTYHTFSGVILRPPSTHPDDEMDTNDLWTYKALAKRGTDLTGYPSVAVYHDFRYHPKEVISGVFDDWIYDHLGVFAFTVEQWDIVGRAGIKDRKFIEWLRDHPHEDDLKVLQWADEHAGKDAYVAWYPAKHPQLGEVELGGWNRMYSWRNPPHAFMDEEATRNVPFALALGDMLPRLTFHTLESRKAGNGYHLHLVVDNSGFFPTHTSNRSKERKVARPVRVELELPKEAKLVSGKRKEEIGHLEGRSNKIGQTFVINSPTDNRGRLEWVIEAPKGAKVKIHVMSERAGAIHGEVVLE